MTDQFVMPTYRWISDVEDIERYQEGGFHPVELNDKIHSRYLIVHKLGYGSYSTVWLARDEQENQYVALKFITADSSIDRAEIEVMRRLGQGEGLFSDTPKFWHLKDESGSEFVIKTLDEFEIRGPNGVHLCIVTEPLGPSLNSMLEHLDGWRLPSNVGRRVAAQLARGLSYLHACGIVHGDLHIHNILFHIPGLNLWTAEEVQEYFGKPHKVKIERIDGQPLTHIAPEYIVRPPSSHKMLSLCLTDTCAIRIADFGEAFVSEGQSHPNKRLNTPVWYAAPEVLFQDPVGSPADIWALACLLYHVLGDHELFESYDGLRDEILTQMVRTFGNLPERWWCRWEKRSHYFSEDGRFQPVSGFTGPRTRKILDLKARLKEMVRGSQEEPLESQEMVAFEKILQGMLNFEPEKRISVDEVVRLLPSTWG